MYVRPIRAIKQCETCGATFSIHNLYEVSKRPVRFCSIVCGKVKYPLNHNYFNSLTPDKLITLGQFIATGFIQNNHTIIIRSDLQTITDIQSKLNSNYPVIKSDQNKLRLKISSSQMVSDLGEYGMVHNPMFQEYIPYDILEGLLRTDCYKMTEGVHTFRTPSSKLALEVARLVSGKIITETYKDTFKGVLGCDWVVVW